MKPLPKKCVDCGNTFSQKHPQQVRCPDCQVIHRRTLSRDYSRKHKKKPKIEDPNECKKIATCLYGGWMGGIRICDYLSITGKRRPCPVKDCTEYIRSNKRRSKAKEEVM